MKQVLCRGVTIVLWTPQVFLYLAGMHGTLFVKNYTELDESRLRRVLFFFYVLDFNQNVFTTWHRRQSRPSQAALSKSVNAACESIEPHNTTYGKDIYNVLLK